MVFSWLDAREAKQFGASLAAFYVAQMPLDKQLNEKKFAAKTQSVLRNMAGRVDAFKAAHGLNGYKKAQLGNAFKWSLKDAGYDAAYIDKLTDWLVTRL
jgi:hypothetical protein